MSKTETAAVPSAFNAGFPLPALSSTPLPGHTALIYLAAEEAEVQSHLYHQVLVS